MKQYRATMTTDTFSAEVDIMHTRPTEFELGDWSGVGVSKTQVREGPHNTNLGEIIISESRYSGDAYKFSFAGNGAFHVPA